MAGLFGCTQAPPAQPPADTDTEVIGPSGGELSATGGDGTSYRVEFPPGALVAPTEVTLAALEADEIGRFRIEPAGLLLAQAATVEVRPAAQEPVPGDAVLLIDGGTAPTFVSATANGPTLSAQLRYFSVPPSAARPAALVPAQAGGEGDQVAAVQAGCLERLESLDLSYSALLATNSFEAALRVVLNAAALADGCALTEEAVAWLDRISVPACARYEDLALLARVTAADGYDVFNELLQPVANWAGSLLKLGLECEGAPSVVDLVEEKASQYVGFYAGEVSGPDFPSDYDGLMSEAQKLLTLREQAHLLGLDALDAQVKQLVMDPVMGMLRDRSFDECLEDADHYYLYSLLMSPFVSRRVPIGTFTPLDHHAGFTDAQVVTDIQYCASNLTVEVWGGGGVPEEIAGQRRALGPGEGPGQQTAEAETGGPVSGHLVLRGPIEQLRCGEDRTLVEHELVVRFAGQEVHRLPSLGSNPEVDVAATLTAAGLDPAGPNTVDLVVRRESAVPCGPYGDAFDLFRVRYAADPAPRIATAAASPGTIAAETETDITFSLDWSDGGENARRLRVEYRLGESRFVTEVDVQEGEGVAGFTGPQGTGTFTATHFVYCSEEGEGPLRAVFSLVDEYGQESGEASVDVPVSFGACGGSIAGPPPQQAVVLGGPR